MADTVYIYALRCPVDGRIKYVGQSKSVESRVASHMSENKDSPKNEWLSALKSQHLNPTVEILDSVTVDVDPATALERAWMQRLLADGEPLTNSRSGPRGPRPIEHDGSKLKKLRQRRLWLIGNLAEQSGVHRNVISKLENGRGGAYPETIRKIAEALEVEPADLLED